MDERNEPYELPQTEQKHPERYQRDLNPDRLAGQNIGPASEDAERTAPTAWDLQLHLDRPWLGRLSPDELDLIPVLPVGSRLQQGATYLDLAASPPEAFTATGDRTASEGNLYVPKDQVPFEVWNTLLGEETP